MAGTVRLVRVVGRTHEFLVEREVAPDHDVARRKEEADRSHRFDHPPHCRHGNLARELDLAGDTQLCGEGPDPHTSTRARSSSWMAWARKTSAVSMQKDPEE